jgi:hypothetical protein
VDSIAEKLPPSISITRSGAPFAAVACQQALAAVAIAGAWRASPERTSSARKQNIPEFQ